MKLVQEIERRGAIESAHRTLRTCSQIFRYGIVTGRLSSDVTLSLKGALSPIKSGHFSAITDVKKFKGLLSSIEYFSGSKVVKAAEWPPISGMAWLSTQTAFQRRQANFTRNE